MKQTGAHTSEAAGCIEVLYPEPKIDVGHFEGVAENLKIPFVFVYFDSYANLKAEAVRRLKAGQIFVMYWWSPEPFISYALPSIDSSQTLIPLTFPEGSKECSAAMTGNPGTMGKDLKCRIPGYLLGKALNRHYAENTGQDGRDLHSFWKRWSFTDADYSTMFTAETEKPVGSSTMVQDMCTWAKNNVGQWKKAIYNTIPPPDPVPVNMRIYNDTASGLGFRAPFDHSMNGKMLAQYFDEGERYGILGTLLTDIAKRTSFRSPGTFGRDSNAFLYDFKLDITSEPARNRGPMHQYGGRKAPRRKSWEFSPALWSAADMCNDLLMRSDADAVRSSQLEVLVVPLEPPVTHGYHPCWDRNLIRVKIYSPRLAIMIRDEPLIEVNLYIAAVSAMFGQETLKGIFVFFLGAVISALIIWSVERHYTGLYREDEVPSFPVSINEGFDEYVSERERKREREREMG